MSSEMLQLRRIFTTTLTILGDHFHEPILAGGAARDYHHGAPIKDLDVFVPLPSGSLDPIRDTKHRLEKLGLIVSAVPGSVMEGDPAFRGSWVLEIAGIPYPVNVVLLALPEAEWSFREVLKRLDFGICQVGFRMVGSVLASIATPAAHQDMLDKTFTIVSSHSLKRTLTRFQRLRAKYPQHILINQHTEPF